MAREDFLGGCHQCPEAVCVVAVGQIRRYGLINDVMGWSCHSTACIVENEQVAVADAWIEDRVIAECFVERRKKVSSFL